MDDSDSDLDSRRLPIPSYEAYTRGLVTLVLIFKGDPKGSKDQCRILLTTLFHFCSSCHQCKDFPTDLFTDEERDALQESLAAIVPYFAENLRRTFPCIANESPLLLRTVMSGAQYLIDDFVVQLGDRKLTSDAMDFIHSDIIAEIKGHLAKMKKVKTAGTGDGLLDIRFVSDHHGWWTAEERKKAKERFHGQCKPDSKTASILTQLTELLLSSVPA